MKRCGECGWPNNIDSASHCEKCGAPLEASHNPPPAPSPNTPPPNTNAGDGKKTIIGGGHNMPSWDAHTPSNPQPPAGGGTGSILKCSSCGFYPLRAELSPSTPCPNCGTTGVSQGAAPQSASSGNQNLKKTQMFGDISFDDAKPKRFKLIENNQQERLFEGETVQLGRENIDPQNYSISGNHATVEMIDGQWHLSNQSSNGFTFVQVKGKVALNDGDIVVIGNKIFQFKSE